MRSAHYTQSVYSWPVNKWMDSRAYMNSMFIKSYDLIMNQERKKITTIKRHFSFEIYVKPLHKMRLETVSSSRFNQKIGSCLTAKSVNKQMLIKSSVNWTACRISLDGSILHTEYLEPLTAYGQWTVHALYYLFWI